MNEKNLFLPIVLVRHICLTVIGTFNEKQIFAPCISQKFDQWSTFAIQKLAVSN